MFYRQAADGKKVFKEAFFYTVIDGSFLLLWIFPVKVPWRYGYR
ncbi:MAG: hypothetical protein ACLUIQ_05380 [Dialister invisus]